MTDSPSLIRSVCVYCGSSPGTNGAYVESAALLGKTLAQAGIRLVYGGGDSGLMGAAARGALSVGGKVTGIIPEFLVQLEQSKGTVGLDGAEMVVVPDMHTRKQKMFEQADAFVALPGGIGTLEELVEIMTWAQLGRHMKPMGVLNTDDFWSPLLSLLDHMKSSGFLHNPERTALHISPDPEALVQDLTGLELTA